MEKYNNYSNTYFNGGTFGKDGFKNLEKISSEITKNDYRPVNRSVKETVYTGEKNGDKYELRFRNVDGRKYYMSKKI